LIADKYGIAGFFILVLVYALNKQFGVSVTQSIKDADAHDAERKLLLDFLKSSNAQMHDDLKENTKALNELRANLGTFCGDRRRRNDTEN